VSADLEQPLDVRHDDIVELPEVVVVPGGDALLLRGRAHAIVAMGVEILHVDDHQGRLLRHDLEVDGTEDGIEDVGSRHRGTSCCERPAARTIFSSHAPSNTEPGTAISAKIGVASSGLAPSTVPRWLCFQPSA